ncbi:glycosyl hydrolase [Neocallimastix sp. 'constans']|jgi:arabinoxylan arabinofuranohydrolase
MKNQLFKSAIAIAAALMSSVSAEGAKSFEGVTVGKSYKDVANNNPLSTVRYSADPGVMVYNDRIYVYATNDGSVANKYETGNDYAKIVSLNLMSSDDLVNWMDHGSIPVAGKGNTASWATNSWAPYAVHKKINGKEKFFLYFANSGNGVGVVSSDSPTGPFTDPIGKPLIDKNTPTCDKVTWIFDPAALVDNDENETGYLFFGGGIPGNSVNDTLEAENAPSPKTHRVVKLGADMVSLDGEPKPIEAPWSFEDSGINKIGSTYYYSYCTNFFNGTLGNGRIAYMTSQNPLGPYEYQDVVFNNPEDFFGTGGNNHHTIINFKDKYYIFYHAEWLNKQIFNEQRGYRTTHVNELPFADGKFGKAKGDLTGVQQVKDVDGSKLQYAANNAWNSGINISGQGEVTQVQYDKGSWTGVSNVFLGDAKSITLKASSAKGATIRISVDNENGPVLGYVEIPESKELKEVSADLTNTSGVKDLFFVASANATIESWQLIGGTPAPVESGSLRSMEYSSLVALVLLVLSMVIVF